MSAAMDGPALLQDLHGQLLRLLSEKAGCHCQGIHQAARRCRGLSNRHLRQLRNVEVAYHVLRHITAPFVRVMAAEIQVALQAQPVAPPVDVVMTNAVDAVDTLPFALMTHAQQRAAAMEQQLAALTAMVAAKCTGVSSATILSSDAPVFVPCGTVDCDVQAPKQADLDDAMKLAVDDHYNGEKTPTDVQMDIDRVEGAALAVGEMPSASNDARTSQAPAVDSAPIAFDVDELPRQSQHEVADELPRQSQHDDELADRICAVAPALRELLSGRQPCHLKRLRRNVALHAEAKGLQVATATAPQLKKAQKGRRLAPEEDAVGKWPNAQAKAFVPGTLWTPDLDDELAPPGPQAQPAAGVDDTLASTTANSPGRGWRQGSGTGVCTALAMCSALHHAGVDVNIFINNQLVAAALDVWLRVMATSHFCTASSACGLGMSAHWQMQFMLTLLHSLSVSSWTSYNVMHSYAGDIWCRGGAIAAMARVGAAGLSDAPVWVLVDVAAHVIAS
eukprot:CAMPEP_0172840806 /NCGR_PEP_ID=MMETSP1075-20121228/29576_1 /TAXON_ID=2916 /ORGANISM="Ceratium fusus, Strain PA161109" /LENGTH=504 /DNA_ID=CAMNT_0013684703 /DNA_START=49 /DNA_END=1564 /DNA_ORIENTATION=-